MTRNLGIAGLVAAGLIIALTGLSGEAQAQRTGRSAYCAIFSDDGGMDCSYPTMQSCLTAVRGVGGSCNVNPRGPGGSAPPGFFERMMRGNGSAFAPAEVGPPPSARRAPPPPSARRPTGMDGRYCSLLYDGSMNCSFSTLQSCLTAVRGVGGSCNVNPRNSWQ
jgi:hypothetical protein